MDIRSMRTQDEKAVDHQRIVFATWLVLFLNNILCLLMVSVDTVECTLGPASLPYILCSTV